MTKSKKNVVLIFAKKPEPGKVKTRIAIDTSPKIAYEIARVCFRDLLNSICLSKYYDILVMTDSVEELSWFEKNYGISGVKINTSRKKATKEEKIHRAFKQIFDKQYFDYEKAILIPMDLPFIQEEDLISTFAQMDSYSYVLGPEINGGIYLIGVNSPYHNNITKNIRFSTSHAFNDLLKNCPKDKVLKLKYRNDLNTFQDILNSKNEIAHHCPLLFELLQKEGYYKNKESHYVDFDTLPICIPVVSAIVQRNTKEGREVLLQTRFKPSIDPKYSGLIEIPSGLIKRYEIAQDAAIREVKEETGLDINIVQEYKPFVKEGIYKDRTVVYKPFCCNQQLFGGRAYISIVFICEVKSGNLTEAFSETINPRWYTIKQIEKIIKKTPNKIFPLNLPVIEAYIKYIK